MASTHRSALAVAAFCATFCLTGCFTIDHAQVLRTGEEHMLVSNYGWYLFHFIPVACGNASESRWFPWVHFRDDVTMDKIQHRFISTANELGRPKVRDLAYTTRESVMLEIPGLNLPLPIPYLLTYREIQLSGIMGEEEENAQ